MFQLSILEPQADPHHYLMGYYTPAELPCPEHIVAGGMKQIRRLSFGLAQPEGPGFRLDDDRHPVMDRAGGIVGARSVSR